MRDFAFVVSQDVAARALVKAAQAADKELIATVCVFDVFEGASLGENKKSIGIEVKLQPRDHTLTDEEIEVVADKVVANVTKKTGGILRS